MSSKKLVLKKSEDEDLIKYAGTHLILDLWGAKNIDSVTKIRKILTEAARISGATLLGVNLHRFSPQGISGVAIISESHISVHTWPEYKYTAFDIFMCGENNPYKAVEFLEKTCQPVKMEIIEIKRGIMTKM